MTDDSIAFVETPIEIADLMTKLITKGKNAKILDTGCGKGVFIKSLSKASFVDVSGIELNKDRVSLCKKEFPTATFYNGDFLSLTSTDRYDVIIGNPPYMHFNTIPIEIRKRVSNITKTEESDIYYAFILKSIGRLRDGGELIYIVPYNFFYNTYASVVRKKLLENGRIDLVIDLDESRLFKDNHPETIIFKFIKTRRSIPMRIVRIKTRSASLSDIATAWDVITQKKENDIYMYQEREQFKHSDTIWSLYPEIKIPQYTFLERIADVGVGFVAGYVEAFLLSDDEIDRLNDDEKKCVYDFVGAKNCKSFWTEGTSQYMILNAIQDENTLREKYPNFYDKLLSHTQSLTNRYLPKGVRWFDWMALRNKSSLDQNAHNPKIFVPTMDRHKKNRFSMTCDFAYADGSVNLILPHSIDPFFLLGYLNSDFFRDYYLSCGARRGGRISFSQSVLCRCKIPTFIKKIETRISEISREIFDNNDASRRVEIDEIIGDAFKKKLFRKVGIDKFLSCES